MPSSGRIMCTCAESLATRLYWMLSDRGHCTSSRAPLSGLHCSGCCGFRSAAWHTHHYPIDRSSKHLKAHSPLSLYSAVRLHFQIQHILQVCFADRTAILGRGGRAVEFQREPALPAIPIEDFYDPGKIHSTLPQLVEHPIFSRGVVCARLQRRPLVSSAIPWRTVLHVELDDPRHILSRQLHRIHTSHCDVPGIQNEMHVLRIGLSQDSIDFVAGLEIAVHVLLDSYFPPHPFLPFPFFFEGASLFRDHLGLARPRNVLAAP